MANSFNNVNMFGRAFALLLSMPILTTLECIRPKPEVSPLPDYVLPAGFVRILLCKFEGKYALLTERYIQL